VPPVPTVGAWFLGSFSGLSVWAVTADTSKVVASAAKSALLASLIAFLLRNEFINLRKGATWPFFWIMREKSCGRSNYKRTNPEVKVKTATARDRNVL
jgi:hypothetical protein